MRKKIVFFLAAGILLIALGCSKKEMGEPGGNDLGQGAVVSKGTNEDVGAAGTCSRLTAFINNHMFSIGSDNKVYVRYHSGSAWTDWFLWNNNLPNGGTAKCVTPLLNDHMFAIGTDDRVYVTYTGWGAGWGTWQYWDTGLPEGKAKYVTPFINSHMFAIGIDNKVYVRYHSGSAWTSWFLWNNGLPNGGTAKSVTPLINDHMFAIGTDDRVYVTYTGWGTGWGTWGLWNNNLPNGGTAKSVTPLINGHMFAIGTDDRLYVTYTGWGTGWGTWQYWDTGLPEGKVKYVTSFINSHMFAVGMDNKVYVRYHSGSAWTSWFLWNNNLPNGGTAILVTPLIVGHIFAIGSDNNVYVTYTGWGSGWGTWQPWTTGLPGGGTTPTPPTGGVTLPATYNPALTKSLATSVLVGTYELTGGASGYQMVYEVDVTQIKNVPATSSDPYWWQYYRKFWDASGNYIGKQGSQYTGDYWDARNMSGYGDCKLSDHSFSPNQTITIPSNYYCPESSSFKYSELFNSRGMTSNDSDMDNEIWIHHRRGKIGEWVPGGGSLGYNYAVPSVNLSGVTHGFLIELYQKVLFPNTGGFGFWRTVHSGEVTPDGWAIVPMNPWVMKNGQGVQWVFIKPKGKALQVRTSGTQCPRTGVINEYPQEGMTACIIDPALWKAYNGTVTCNGTSCRDAAGYDVIPENLAALIPAGTYDSKEKVMEALSRVQIAFGADTGYIFPDFSKSGTFVVVNPDGTWAEITFDQAKVIYGAYRFASMNGSGLSLTGAVKSTEALAKAASRPIVLVYMAQNLNYPYATETSYVINAKTAMTNLLNAVTGAGTVIGHSWSGHLVLDITKNRSAISTRLYNPAQVPGSSIAVNFINNIQSATTDLKILSGTNDKISNYGMGMPLTPTGGCNWSQALCDAVKANYKASNAFFNSGHGIQDMVNAGAGSGQLPKYGN